VLYKAVKILLTALVEGSDDELGSPGAMLDVEVLVTWTM
jgi:hypothetical protein